MDTGDCSSSCMFLLVLLQLESVRSIAEIQIRYFMLIGALRFEIWGLSILLYLGHDTQEVASPYFLNITLTVAPQQ